MWSSITTPDRYRSPLTGEWRNSDEMEAWLIEAIDGATEEVLVAVQKLSLPRVAQALIAAKQRGIRLRWRWNTTISRPGMSNEPDG